MGQLGIEYLFRSERVFRTHQDRLVKELARITMDEANRYMAGCGVFCGSAFVDCRDLHVLDDILC